MIILEWFSSLRFRVFARKYLTQRRKVAKNGNSLTQFLKKIFPLCFLSCSLHAQNTSAFRNASLPIESRVSDLLKQLTLEEKISLLGYQSKAVSRLGISDYNWWNEALHGVARAGNATVFPQAIGMAASFNNELLLECANTISTEARAKYNLAFEKGLHLQYMGLTFWSPNINIFRDPRWGRGQETYGEDPFLTATMGSAFIKGVQGNDKDHLKAAACAKHFAVHSGPERERHGFNAIVDEKDLRETYLYAFKKLVDAGVESIMCAYNRVNGEPCCTSNTLLHHILHDEWKFSGQVLTDCGALNDISSTHKTYASDVEVAAAAIKTGVSLDCGNILQRDVMKAIQQKLLSEKDVDNVLSYSLKTAIKLGFFDDHNNSSYAIYGADSVTNAYHTMLARKMAQQSMVLLKNDKNILPLDKNKYHAYMVVGPNAMSLDALLGSYHGVSDKAVNFVEGITHAVDAATRVEYDMGCDYKDTSRFGGIWAAGNADITIAVIGLTAVYEGEEGDAFLAEGGADRKNLSLPASHIAYMKALRKGTKTPIIAVITSGSAVDVAAIAPYADAVILAWYPGEQGGNALADILFGKISPSGHLPVTFYNSFNDLPAYNNYSMEGRTYRYFKGKVQYPFGFGLSYTNFKYEWISQPTVDHDAISFSVNITNTGNFDGDEVIQAYFKYPDLPRMPVKELKGFKRVSLKKNETQKVEFKISIGELQKWDTNNRQWKLYPGAYRLLLGSNSADEKLAVSINLSGH
ncbi:MAG: glycoside hydrolase family 3 C-terminal domain-containing protein [Bacteroidetes bacterium]|nr:glycoside hydrolase family 3 C-terminal domain-containing protein [Bacteroidota bacterium]